MNKLAEIIYICSPRTKYLLEDSILDSSIDLEVDSACPNYTKLAGRGRKKLFGVIYRIRIGQGVDTLLIENIYDWRKEK